jgi:carbon storage regulator
MLVIRRRRGETPVIGENVEIEILGASPWQVNLGIRAPKPITVLRNDQDLASAREIFSAEIERLADSLKNSPLRPISPV